MTELGRGKEEYPSCVILHSEVEGCECASSFILAVRTSIRDTYSTEVEGKGLMEHGINLSKSQLRHSISNLSWVTPLRLQLESTVQIPQVYIAYKSLCSISQHRTPRNRMPIFTLCAVFTVLHLWTYLCGESNANPLNPTVVEVRIPKNSFLGGSGYAGGPSIAVNNIALNARDVRAISDYTPHSTTIATIEHLLRMQRQKREAVVFMKREAELLEPYNVLSMRKRQEGPKCDKKKKKKYKLCDGIYKMFWNAATKSCEACKAGQEPTPKADQCVDPETPEDEKKRGKCPVEKIFDPAVPGQVTKISTAIFIGFDSNIV